MVMNEYKVMMADEFLRDKLEKIWKKLEQNDIQTAYETTQLLINYINIDFLRKKYNIIKLQDSQMRNIINLYRDREEFLYRKNNNINNVYIDVSERKPYKVDVINLLYDAEEICNYKKEKYGM